MRLFPLVWIVRVPLVNVGALPQPAVEAAGCSGAPAATAAEPSTSSAAATATTTLLTITELLPVRPALRRRCWNRRERTVNRRKGAAADAVFRCGATVFAR
ncbi:hypothetical protein GCM10017567_17310 [Amycolatopsis bullii]|uniref:Secreted protein n=1 Tax=Amycolatopsis bullii TaxID=941987 RepID=A0ABQ3K529_9PSEU|nr:hypothetical protein GCM10017567_17310 [Amycolatopsis bullii]